MSDASTLDPGEALVRYEGATVGAHYVRVAGDDHTPHAHDDLQLFVAFAGRSMRAMWSGAYGDRRRFTFENEHAHVVDAGQTHRFDWSFIDMVSAFASREYVADVLREAFPASRSIGDVRCLDDAIVVGYAMRLALEIRSPHPDALAVETAVIAMFARVAERLTKRSARVPSLSSGEWERLVAFVEAHLSEPLSLVRLADVAGIPPYALGRAFRARCGVSPHRWIRSRRLARAKIALLGDADIAAIALDTGFAQQSHFTAAFRAENGITPARYRRLAARSAKI